MSVIGRRPGTGLMEFFNQLANPGATLTRVKIYGKAVSGVTQLFAQLSDGTVIQLTPGLGARQMVNEMWGVSQVPASQTSVAMSCLVSQLFDSWTAERAGSIISLRTKFDTPVTAGTLTATVAVNGTPGTLAVVSTSGSNPSGGLATQAAGAADTFVAGDTLSIVYTSTGAFTPITLNMEAYLEIYVNNV